jgi:hypothetical protein
LLRYKSINSFLKYSSSGHPFRVWREEPSVPRFDDEFLDCSLYLYSCEEDAIKGDRSGGSGFLLSVDGIEANAEEGTEPTGDEFYYAVSNRHVVDGSPVVRLNREDGKHDVLPFTFSDWTSARDDDIAVAPISVNPANKYLFISVGLFLTNDKTKKYDVGIGDEVFMVGRLVNHDGRQRNLPSLRCGHISMMPFEPVYHKTNPSQTQESFLVEIHSISGYSGSPVFVRPFRTEKLRAYGSVHEKTARVVSGPWFLGVDWGYINNHDQSQNNTGVSAVVPAWKLIDLLNTEKLRMQRSQEKQEREEARRRGGTTLTSTDAAK